MEPTTPRRRRSKSRLREAPRARSSNGVRRGSITPSTPRNKSPDFCVSTPSTVDSTDAFDDDFPFDSPGEWMQSSSFQTPKRESSHSLTREELRQIQACSPLVTPQQRPKTPRYRRSLSGRTEHSNESNDSHSSPRRRPRRTSSTKLEEQFLVMAPTVPETPRPQPPPRRRSSSIEPRRRRTSSVERRRGGDLVPRRRLSMSKIGSAPPPTKPPTDVLASPAARRLARHTQSVQQLSREMPLRSAEERTFGGSTRRTIRS